MRYQLCPGRFISDRCMPDRDHANPGCIPQKYPPHRLEKIEPILLLCGLCLDNLLSSRDDIFRRVTCIDHEFRVVDKHLIINGGMVGRDQDRIV